MKDTIILDCDPGIDDAVALAIVLAAENLNVQAITTCAGNQLPIKTYTNARNLLSLMGREDIPVYQGAQKPFYRQLIIADHVHGNSGLGPVSLPESSAPHTKQSALMALTELLSAAVQPITILATGPLTNVGMLLLAHPELKEKIRRIVLMGGACHGGNVTPVGEFNIVVDPEAADIVFRSGVPICMFGLDVSRKAQFMREDIEALRSVGNHTAVALADMLDFYTRTTQEPILPPPNHVEGVHMHDPCAAAYLVAPELFDLVELNVVVETKGQYTAGCTVVDYYHTSNRKPNAQVAFGIDRMKFVNLIYDLIANLK